MVSTVLLIALLITVSGTLNIACFFIGAKVGQNVSKDIPLKMPKINNPIKAHEERKVQKHEKEEQDRIRTILENIENYNGTAQGQKDVPESR